MVLNKDRSRQAAIGFLKLWQVRLLNSLSRISHSHLVQDLGPPLRKRGAKIALTIVVLLLAIGVGFGVRARVDGAVDAEYLTTELTRGDVIAVVAATGTVKAVQEVKVGSQLSGQIAELFVDFNDAVTAGQAIAQLDPRTHEARVREARAAVRVAHAKVALQGAAIAQTEAELITARAKLKVVEERLGGAQARSHEAKRRLGRVQVLREKGMASEANADQVLADSESSAALLRAENAQVSVERAAIASAEANLLKAKAELEDAVAALERQEALLSQAEIELSRTVIRSPVDGVIIGRKVDRGQTVAASLEAPVLFEIARDLSAMEVHIRIDEADIGQVQVGQRITFMVDAYRGRTFSGRVKQLRKSPEVVNNVVIYTVVVATENPERLLLPGMTASVRILVAEAPNALRVPNAALRFRPTRAAVAEQAVVSRPTSASEVAELATVWVLDREKHLAPVQFRLGPSDGHVSEMRDGPLKPGDRVVVGMVRPPQRNSYFGLRLGF